MEEIACVAIISASAAIILSEKIEKQKKRTRVWVKPWRLRRQNESSFKLLYNELRLEDKDAFRRYLRLDEDCYVELLGYVRKDIQKSDTLLRAAIPAEETLAICLRFLATGESYRSLDYQSRLSVSFISTVMTVCCTSLYTNLKNQYLKCPSSKQEWEKIAEDFHIRWQFPLCLGALDGKHIAFRASKTDGAFYYNYKGFNSIVLLAMCTADYRFTFVDIGCNGRVSDAGVMNRSDLRFVLQNADEYFPADKNIGNNRSLPYCIIADDAFALERHLLKPYPYNSKEEVKKIFNFRLSHARQTIEHTFGILSNKFRVLQTNIHLRPNKVKKIVQACCVLHNYLLEKNRLNEHDLSIGPKKHTPANYLESAPRKPERLASTIRDNFAAYFTEEGQLPWQKQFI